MGQARPIKIALVIDEDLSFINEAAEPRGMDDPVPIPLKFAAVLGFLFLILPPETLLLVRSVGLKRIHYFALALRSAGLRRNRRSRKHRRSIVATRI